jgi:hypothetical protein
MASFHWNSGCSFHNWDGSMPPHFSEGPAETVHNENEESREVEIANIPGLSQLSEKFGF